MEGQEPEKIFSMWGRGGTDEPSKDDRSGLLKEAQGVEIGGYKGAKQGMAVVHHSL